MQAENSQLNREKGKLNNTMKRWGGSRNNSKKKKLKSWRNMAFIIKKSKNFWKRRKKEKPKDFKGIKRKSWETKKRGRKNKRKLKQRKKRGNKKRRKRKIRRKINPSLLPSQSLRKNLLNQDNLPSLFLEKERFSQLLKKRLQRNEKKLLKLQKSRKWKHPLPKKQNPSKKMQRKERRKEKQRERWKSK